MKTFTKHFMAASAALACATWTYGTPTLTIDDGPGGGVTIVIVDQGVGDSNPAVGAVTWIGSIGVWDINVTAGMTKPAQGSATVPELALNTQSSSTGAGTLKIQFSEINFGPLAAGFGFVAQDALTALATGGSVTYKTYGDVGNVPNGNDGVHAQSSVTTLVTPFSTQVPAPAGGPLALPYSLTAEIDITHTGEGTSQPSMVLKAVPDAGSTLLLLGSSLMTLGFFVRSRKQAATK